MGINADNKKDTLVGSFSGVPQIIMGDANGYAVPEAMRDSSGETVLIAVYSAMLNGVTKKEEQKKVVESKEFKVLSKKLRFATEKVKV